MEKQGFFSVLVAEFIRVFARPKALIFSGAAVIVAILAYAGMLALTDWGVSQMSDGGQAIEVGFMGFGIVVSVLSFYFGIYAAAFSARDYGDGTIVSSLLTVPKRVRLFFARLIPWFIVPFLFTLPACIVAFLMSLGSITDTGGAVALIFLSALSVACSSVLGFCCGSITKKGSLSVLAFLALFFIFPTMLGIAGGVGPEILVKIASGLNHAMPGNAFSAMTSIAMPEGGDDAVIGCAVTAAWTILLPVLSFILFKKRATLGK